MQIPIGARIDRKTWEITPLYREGSEEELYEALRPFFEIARKVKRERATALKIAAEKEGSKQLE